MHSMYDRILTNTTGNHRHLAEQFKPRTRINKASHTAGPEQPIK